MRKEGRRKIKEEVNLTWTMWQGADGARRKKIHPAVSFLSFSDDSAWTDSTNAPRHCRTAPLTVAGHFMLTQFLSFFLFLFCTQLSGETANVKQIPNKRQTPLAWREVSKDHSYVKLTTHQNRTADKREPKRGRVSHRFTFQCLQSKWGELTFM